MLSTTHLIRIAGLEAEKSYPIWIIGGFWPKKLAAQTSPQRSNPPFAPQPVYGTIYAPDGGESKLASGVLAHLTADGAKNTLTTRTDDNGSYSFDLANLFDSNYQPFYLSEEGGILKLQFLDGKFGQTYLEVDFTVASPVPPVMLSKSQKLRLVDYDNDFKKVLGATSRLIAKIADEDIPVKKKTTVTSTTKAPSTIKEEIQSVQQYIAPPNIQSPPAAPPPVSSPPSQPQPDQGVDNAPPASASPPASPPAPVTCARRVLMTQCNSCGVGAELIQTESCGETWGSMGPLAACNTAALCQPPTPVVPKPPTDLPDVPVAPTAAMQPTISQKVSTCWDGRSAPDGDPANCPPRPTVLVSPPVGDTPAVTMAPKPTFSRAQEALKIDEAGGRETESKTCARGFVEGQSWQSECQDTKRIKYFCANGLITSSTMFDPSCPGYYQQHIIPQDANLETVCSADQRFVVSKKNPILEIEECLAGTTCTGGECTVYQSPPKPTQSFNEALVSFFLPEPTEPILPKPTEVIQPPVERKVDRECSFSSDCPSNQTCVGFKCVPVELRPTSVSVSPTLSPIMPQCPGGYVSGQSWQLDCQGTKREVATCSDGKILTSLALDTSCSGKAEETDIPFIAPTISPAVGGRLTSACEEETSPLLCGGSTKQLQCWFTARDKRGECTAGLFCSGKCQETRESQPPTPEPTKPVVPTPTLTPPAGQKIDKECSFSSDCPSNQTCVGFKCVPVELRPTSVSATHTSIIEHDYCDRGETYCVDSSKEAVCKADRSGYDRIGCDAGTSCDVTKNHCIVPPAPTPVIATVSLGGQCDDDSKCQLGLFCSRGSCKTPRWNLIVTNNITRSRECVLSETGKYAALEECRQDELLTRRSAVYPGGWRYDPKAGKCIQSEDGIFSDEEQCYFYIVDRPWYIDRESRDCVQKQDLAGGSYLTRIQCEEALKSYYPPISTSTPTPTPERLKEILIKQDEISEQELNDLPGKPCSWAETDVVFKGKVTDKYNECRVYCSTDNIVKVDYCVDSVPQSVTQYDFNLKKNEPCDPNIDKKSSYLVENKMTCGLSCDPTGKILKEAWCKLSDTDKLPGERWCQDDTVVVNESNAETVVLEKCGYKEGRQESEQTPLCRDGACIQDNVSDTECTYPGEILPALANNHYIYCDTQSNLWTPLANNQPVVFADSCPNSYREFYLGVILENQDFTFTPGGLGIECYERLTGVISGEITPVGGLGGGKYINEPISIVGNPNNPNLSDWSRYVLVHELGHTYVAEFGFLQDAFAKEIGCMENSQNVGEYRFLNENPTSEYGTTNCAEAFAEAVTRYKETDSYGRNLACEMKERFPIQYNWMRENIYHGNEFCNQN